jgi:hypothetical protein
MMNQLNQLRKLVKKQFQRRSKSIIANNILIDILPNQVKLSVSIHLIVFILLNPNKISKILNIIV